MLKAIIALAVLLVVVLAARAIHRRGAGGSMLVPVVNGRFVLRNPRKNGVLLAISALFPTALVVALTIRAASLDRVSVAGLVVAGVVSLAGLAFGAYQLVYAFRSCIVVDDTGLDRVGVVQHRRVSWRDVVRIDHNPHHRWFYVTTQRGKHLWISDELPGIPQFADLALRRLPPPVLQGNDDVREVLEELAAPART